VIVVIAGFLGGGALPGLHAQVPSALKTTVTGVEGFRLGMPLSAFTRATLGQEKPDRAGLREFVSVDVPFTVEGRTYNSARQFGFLNGRLGRMTLLFHPRLDATIEPMKVMEALRRTAFQTYAPSIVKLSIREAFVVEDARGNRFGLGLAEGPAQGGVVVEYLTPEYQKVMNRLDPIPNNSPL